MVNNDLYGHEETAACFFTNGRAGNDGLESNLCLIKTGMGEGGATDSTQRSSQTEAAGLLGDEVPCGSLFHRRRMRYLDLFNSVHYPRLRFIRRDQIVLGELLGEGHFGTVNKGEYVHIREAVLITTIYDDLSMTRFWTRSVSR
jgi:hypothetical protein